MGVVFFFFFCSQHSVIFFKTPKVKNNLLHLLRYLTFLSHSFIPDVLAFPEPFPIHLRISSDNSLEADLLAMNSLRFPSSVKNFISSSFLENLMAGEFCVDNSFLSALKAWTILLALMISDEKVTVI